MSNRLFIAIYIIAGFLLGAYGQDLLQAYEILPSPIRGWLPNLVQYFLWYLLIPGLFVGLLHGFPLVGKELGLAAPITKGLQVALLCLVPMLLGGAILNNFNIHWTWSEFLFGSLLAGLCEEVLYRGFLFGQLYRQARWPFFPAAMISALIFGSMHLYQGETWQEAAGVFAITLAGGLWFSWLYVRWSYNLWVPIFLHFLMNLTWTMFDLGNNALGGLWPNVLRAATIGISVYLTYRYTAPLDKERPANSRLAENHL